MLSADNSVPQPVRPSNINNISLQILILIHKHQTLRALVRILNNLISIEVNLIIRGHIPNS